MDFLNNNQQSLFALGAFFSVIGIATVLLFMFGAKEPAILKAARQRGD